MAPRDRSGARIRPALVPPADRLRARVTPALAAHLGRPRVPLVSQRGHVTPPAAHGSRRARRRLQLATEARVRRRRPPPAHVAVLGQMGVQRGRRPLATGARLPPDGPSPPAPDPQRWPYVQYTPPETGRSCSLDPVTNTPHAVDTVADITRRTYNRDRCLHPNHTQPAVFS